MTNFKSGLRWRPKNQIAVLVPCAGTKPFPAAPSHRDGYLPALEGKPADLWVVSEPLGVVPYDWSRRYPNNAYDFPPKFLRGEAWDALVERVAEWLEKVAPKYRKVFVALPGHHERLLRAALEVHNPGNLRNATHTQCLESGACPPGHGRSTSTKYRRYLGAVVRRNPDEGLRRLERTAATGDETELDLCRRARSLERSAGPMPLVHVPREREELVLLALDPVRATPVRVISERLGLTFREVEAAMDRLYYKGLVDRAGVPRYPTLATRGWHELLIPRDGESSA